MIFDRLANEHPETCTWKQQEIPCSSKGSFVGSHAVVLSGEVIDAGFANPVENCFVKKYHDVEKLEVKQKVWTPNLQIMINRSVFFRFRLQNL